MKMMRCLAVASVLLLLDPGHAYSCSHVTTRKTTTSIGTPVVRTNIHSPNNSHQLGNKAIKLARQRSLELKAINNEVSQPFLPPPVKRTASAASLILLDVVTRKLFQAGNVNFPSSLAGCGALFAAMVSIPRLGDYLQKLLQPGSDLLSKWLPVFFVPSLVTLPLAVPVQTPSELVKVLVVVLGGFYFSLLSTAGSVIGVRRLLSPPVEKGSSDDADSDENLQGVDLREKSNASPTSTSSAAKAFSDDIEDGLRATAVFAAILTAALSRGNSTLKTPIQALFLLSTTLHNFVFGARLPKKITKVVHPLVTCTTLTWAVMKGFGLLVGSSLREILKEYRTSSLGIMSAGAGDVLLFMLGPSVISLALSMYSRRNLVKTNMAEVTVATLVSSVGGLFGTAVAVRILGVTSPLLRLACLSRNITSPLAMAISGILGTDVSAAVSMVVVTGLFGANFGASILDKCRVEDPIARGLAMGSAAHGLGTAAIVDEPDAFPFSAISMALTASTCTVLVSIPLIRNALIRLSLGV